MSRNNVLHLWPFVIQDLRGLGAKKFFGKFCAGSIDHISIRQLQCILLKVALILGVEFHESVSFDSLIPPPENQEDGKIGWRAKTTPADHPVSQYEFDVLIGADGKRNTLEGFKRKEFRGKLAIAITANFINKRTEAEARVEEISGVAFIFNQKFFKELYQETGIDLENIVYYKDDTHYFVMTAKKHSLIDKGVILQDHADTAKLLAKENVDREALMQYAREAAEFSTEYQMMDMEFAVNHYGQPDVAMFDFTSMYAAENASRVLERHGHRLLMILVGDSLLEPFWPTGSGCARGFLSSLDACWAIKGWGASISPLEVIAERESIYRLLGQTTPENLNRDYAAYTLDPHTRYPNLNVCSVTPIQVRSLLDTDDPDSYKHPIQSEVDIPKKRRRRDIRGDAQVHPDTLLRWLQKQVALYDTVHIEDMGASFKDGLAICAIIHRYRPDLIDFHSLQPDDVVQNNQLAFDILEKELGIPPIMTGEEMAQCDVPDKLAMFSYLTQIYEVFRGEIPHIKHPKLEPENEDGKQLSQLTPDQKALLIGRIVRQDSATRPRHSRSRHNENVHLLDKKGDTISRRSRKRRSTEKMGATVEERQRRLAEIEKNRADRMRRRQYMRKMATQQFYKSMQMLQANAKREKDEPFEDYSIFLYRQTAPDFKDRVKYLEQKILYPDREPKIHAGHRRNSIDEEFSGRIKSIEDKLKGSAPSEKKPRDLLRAIGKIEKTDWNVKEIEKKIEESKMGRAVRHDKVERVPKWSREQFLARQIKMEKKGRDQKESDSKYADIDNTLKSIDRKIKEGNVLGYNKVSAMAEQFSNKNQDAQPKVQKSNAKAAVALPAQGGSEMCHFCNKRVYLMERLSAEGKFFHRGCFRCEYCSTSLRIGNHTFDRDKNGGRFYCTQHFGLSGTMKARAEKKRITALNKENIPTASTNVKTPEKTKVGLEGVVGLDLLDRGQTPERIEFENLAGMSDAEEAQSQMDEDEWTDRNFGASTAEMGSSDDISDMSDSDDDNEVYEEAIDQPLTTEGTLELAKNWTLRYSHPHAATGHSDTGSNEYEDSSDEYTSEDDESGTATEDEEDIRARELRKQEVWLKHPTRSSDTDTGSETEVKTSQDSIDKVTQESLVTPEPASAQIPDLISSPVPNVNNSEIVSDNVDGTKDNQDILNSNVLNSNALVIYTGQKTEGVANPVIKEDTSQNEASGSIIPTSSHTLGSITSDVKEPEEKVLEESLISASTDRSPSCLAVENAKEQCYSEYESRAEDSIPVNSEVIIGNSVNVERENTCRDCTLPSSEPNINVANNVTAKTMPDLNISCLDKPSEANVTITNIASDNVISDLNTTCLDTNTLILNTGTPNLDAETELGCTTQSETTGVMIPDAIPYSQANFISEDVPNSKSFVRVDKELTDFIASSPQHSRNSSPSSSSETYESVELSCNDPSGTSLQDKLLSGDHEFYDVEGIEKCKTQENNTENVNIVKDSNVSNDSGNKLKIAIKTAEVVVCPIVTITSPSPTNEKPLESTPIEVTKLTVPKDVPPQPTQPSTNNSFDKLKRDLRQRKARNKLLTGELRPLSIENAQKKISKYFVERKKPDTKNNLKGHEKSDEKTVDEIKIIELDIKPKLSNRVEKKDIMKYFNKTNSLASTGQQEITDNKSKLKTEDSLDSSINELNEVDETDVDIINQLFDQIEEQTQDIPLINDENIDPEFQLNPVPLVPSPQNGEIKDETDISAASENDEGLIKLANDFTALKSSEIKETSQAKKNVQIIADANKDKTSNRTAYCENTDEIHMERPEIPLRQRITHKESATRRNSILPSSDGTLSTRRQVLNETEVSRRNSRSSSDLPNPRIENLEITKVKVIEQNIEVPLLVQKVQDIGAALPQPCNNAPKRPERRHTTHDASTSLQNNSSNVKTVPQIPVRRKSAKRISDNSSYPELASNSVPDIDRLTSRKSGNNMDNHFNSLKESVQVSSSTTIKAPIALENAVVEQSHHTNPPGNLLTNKLDVRESTKPIPPKSDRSKKDKCIIS